MIRFHLSVSLKPGLAMMTQICLVSPHLSLNPRIGLAAIMEVSPFILNQIYSTYDAMTLSQM